MNNPNSGLHPDILAVIEGRSQWCVVTGDCRAVLPTIPAGSVRAVVADIPYGVVSRETGGLRVLDKGLADVETFDAQTIAQEAARVASGSVYVWCGTEQVSGLRESLVIAGMTTRLCVWEKSNPSPMNGSRLWLSGIETCVFGRHPEAWFGVRCQNPIWRGPTERDQVHPTQKPVWLMRLAIEASVPIEGIVLDLCCGSGTTGVAAIQTGRRFIGIEIDEKYAAIARRRIADAAPLFVPPVERVPEPELFGGAS